MTHGRFVSGDSYALTQGAILGVWASDHDDTGIAELYNTKERGGRALDAVGSAKRIGMKVKRSRLTERYGRHGVDTQAARSEVVTREQHSLTINQYLIAGSSHQISSDDRGRVGASC